MQTTLSKEEIVRLGQELYEREIRAHVEPGDNGRFLVMDVLSGKYSISDDDNEAFDRSIAETPNGVHYIIRIGHPAAYRIGWSTGDRLK